MAILKKWSWLGCLWLLVPNGVASGDMTHSEAEPTGSVAALQTKMVLRDLWVEHIFWVRNYVFALHSGKKAHIKVSTDEVVANAKAIAGSLEAFYGKAASDKMFELLAGHWGAVAAYAKATKSGSGDGQSGAKKALQDNARTIADFLGGANPHFSADVLFGALSAHGAHHILQIEAVFDGDYAKEAKDWAVMRKHMLVIADVLVDGLAKQFPDKF